MYIRFDDRGIATMEIEDAKAEVISYRPTVVARGLSLWALELENLANGEVYRIGLELGGWWRCSCPAYFFRKSKDHPRGCKHCSAVKHLYTFLQNMKGPADEQPCAEPRIYAP